MTILEIIIIIAFNFGGAIMTRSFWGDVFRMKGWFCKLWVKILLVLPPIGLIGGALTLVTVIAGIIIGGIYYILIEPVKDYFENCDI